MWSRHLAAAGLLVLCSQSSLPCSQRQRLDEFERQRQRFVEQLMEAGLCFHTQGFHIKRRGQSQM